MKYYHVTETEINQKFFNIFIGISLGNKYITLEHAEKYVKWAYENTRQNVVVLIADELDEINWKVFRKLSSDEAAKKVKKKAYGIKGLFDKAIRNLARKENDPSYIANVHILFWADIKNPGYIHLREILLEEYHSNPLFRNDILYFVDTYCKLRNVMVTDQEKNLLSDYIISELPTLIGGILWNRTLYDLILYPTYVSSSMSEFVLKIREGAYFNASKLMLRQINTLVEDQLALPDSQQLEIIRNEGCIAFCP